RWRHFDCLYTNGFRYYFTPLPGYFSPFPHGTGSLSVVYVYLSLRGGPRRFTPVFSVPAILGCSSRVRLRFTYGAITLFGVLFQNTSVTHRFCNSVTILVHRLSNPTTPYWQRHQAFTPVRFGLIPVRSPLLGESLLFSSPRVTKMFQFTRF